MALDPTMQQLAEAYGIATEFWDWRGRHTAVSAETVTAVLGGLGVDASTDQAALTALHARWHQPWTRMLPPCVVVRQGQLSTFWVHVPHGSPVAPRIQLELGGERSGLEQVENWWPPRDVDGELIGEASFAVPTDLPLGYHTVVAESQGRSARCPLIVTPAWLGIPERMGIRRTWGLATQLYSVRSRDSWGVGDLADLADLAVWSTAEQRAGFILVNPLHAAEPIPPLEPSPYFPTTRRFGNPLYLRVQDIPEYATLDEHDRGTIARLHAEAESAGHVDQLDRNVAWTAKRAALQLLHAAERRPGREIAYRAYRRRQGTGLENYATWCALAEQYGSDWRSWPEPLRRPETADVEAFRTGHDAAVDFHCWLQWLLDEQLATAQHAAVDAGMSLGIVHDLAVGVHPSGADAWSLQDTFAQGVSVGAPPDAFNQSGQDWRQPPWRPDRLAELAYAPFREMVSTVLRHAGGVRVDHIIGLFRLWWIPDGLLPTQGTYVRYDHDALIGILALEAHRSAALVIGEDLGTVEPWVRDYLRDRGILGTSILWFEFDFENVDPAGGSPPLPAERWREYCLASITTHDLPPTAGYLAGDHVRLRADLGLLTRSLDEELTADEAERRAWIDELRARGALADSDTGDSEAVVAALHRYLTWTPARLICLALTDAVGDRRTQNQPGTIDEYPNWRVPLTGPAGQLMLLEDVLTSPRVARLAAVLRG